MKKPLLKFPKNNHMFSKIFVKLVSKMEVHNVPGHYSTYRLHQLSVHLFLENSDLRQDNRIIGPLRLRLIYICHIQLLKLKDLNLKGLFTPNDSIKTVRLTGKTGYATHSVSHTARQKDQRCHLSMLR